MKWTCGLTMLLALATPATGRCTTTIIGYIWSDALEVQTYWSQGRLHGAFANTSARPLRFTVHRDNRAYRAPARPQELLAGPWEIPPGRLLLKDLSLLPHCNYWTFFSENGERLASLPVPKQPPMPGPRLRDAVFSDCDTNQYGSFLTEQDRLTYRSGDLIRIRVTIGGMTDRFSVATQRNTPQPRYDDEIPLYWDKNPYPIAFAESMTADRGIVERKPTHFVVHFQPADFGRERIVELTFRAPLVGRRTFVDLFGNSRWHQRGTGRYWSRYIIVDPPELPLRRSAAELGQDWEALATADRPTTVQLTGILAACDETLPFLREKLIPVAAPDPAHVAQALRDLNSNFFRVREAARKRLESWGESVQADLHETLAATRDPNTARLLNGLLAALDSQVNATERLRLRRAVAILSDIGTPEARRFLEELAAGARGAYLTRQAHEALEPRTE
jgi:hypothetical protein